LSQALVDELTRIAVAKIDEWRSELLNMVERLGREEAAFQICWRVYQWPTGTPKEALDEFARSISLEHLRDLAQKHGLKDVANVVIGVAKTIPKFNPGRGFAIFGEFVEKLIEVAQSSGGLIGYFNKFKSAKALQDELEKLPGVGPVLAPLLVRQLRLADIVKLDISEVGLSAADPVMRVLNRTGLVPKGAKPEEAERMVREKFKVPPMVIDAGLWHVGFHYCREKEPACDICPIARLCPKHV
jgi:hypothetical protein